jgi:hypothetical protein
MRESEHVSVDTQVLAIVLLHFATLHPVSRLHDARVARTTPLRLSGEPLMLCSHAGTRTSRSAASPALCPPPGKFFPPGCMKVGSTSSSRTFMRTRLRANSLAMTT